MTNLSEIPVVNIFKSIILDSLMKDGFIRNAQRSESFFSRNKKYLLAGSAIVAGAALGPFAITGIVAALGFGEAGIVAGSIAAWMMSLHGGAVAAGSLVAILQSVGAAGLGIGSIIAASTGGGMFAGYIAKAILMISESNPEGLNELENFVSINESDDDDEKNHLHKKLIFDMKQPLLDDSNENEKLKSFLRGFDLARQISQDRIRNFKFLCLEGSNFLHNHLVDTYGNDHVTSERGGYSVNVNLNNP
ncbi:14458_t:CDS:1 [Funneliformis geosporum]|uniref:3737_t:CDS:1 n=1 Tax=Funneliformis geosporum TaxID=1117311 RepID=A0A9W4SCI2_9GLOM|nr:3737_t:CDS:1 [Funneliformis geosporum]CAI2171648.1 14458_t:CDS:1 [Funneliformis geosporum]